MSDRTKHFLKKLLWVLVTFIFFEALLIATLTVITLLSELKLDIALDSVLEALERTFTSLPSVISNYIDERNPFFIIGTVVVLVYSFIFHKNSFKKEGWEIETSNAYHGSADWAKENEIFDNKNFKKANKKQIQNNFMKSLKGNDNQ